MLGILKNNIQGDIRKNWVTYMLMALLIAIGMYIASTLASRYDLKENDEHLWYINVYMTEVLWRRNKEGWFKILIKYRGK